MSTGSICDWSKNADENADADSSFTARNGICPLMFLQWGAILCARVAQYLAGNNYNQATLTGTDIIVTLTEDISELSVRLQIFFPTRRFIKINQ